LPPWSCSGPRAGIRIVVAVRRKRLGVGNGYRESLGCRIRSRLLMRRPRSLHWLAGCLEVVDDLRPGPDCWALAGLRGILDQFIQPWVTATVTRCLNCQGKPPVLEANRCDRRPGCSVVSNCFVRAAGAKPVARRRFSIRSSSDS